MKPLRHVALLTLLLLACLPVCARAVDFDGGALALLAGYGIYRGTR